jgi:hypothetical protein
MLSGVRRLKLPHWRIFFTRSRQVPNPHSMPFGPVQQPTARNGAPPELALERVRTNEFVYAQELVTSFTLKSGKSSDFLEFSTLRSAFPSSPHARRVCSPSSEMRAFFKVIRAPSCRSIEYRKKAPRALIWMRFDELIDSKMAEKTRSKLN